MEWLVHLLCIATASACSVLLLRGYRRNGTRLLLRCGLFFLLLSLENLTLFVDQALAPDTDLFTLRTAIALIGVTLLLVGLIWDVG